MTESETYAVIRTQGKQSRVQTGGKIIVDRMTGEAGDAVKLNEVLLYCNAGAVQVGAPLVSGATVEAKIVRHLRGEKVVVYRKRRRKGFTKKRGHRQDQTELLIQSINA